MPFKEFEVLDCQETQKYISLFASISTEFKIRTNIFSEMEFKTFLKNVSSKANVMYHRYTKLQRPKEYVYSETFVCHHSGAMSKINNFKCPVKISVHIKNNNYHARKRDKLISDYPCFISLSHHHNHKIDSLFSVSKLKTLTTAAKSELQEAYKNGMRPKEAINHMKANLTPSKMANRSRLPNLQTAYYEYRQYLAGRFGGLGDEEMFVAIEAHSLKYPDTTISLQRPDVQKPFCLFIQTPLMKRALAQVPQAAEIVFMDSTTNLDQLNYALRTFHTWTPAGGVPIGLCITDSQTTLDYEAALLMLRDSSSYAGFNGFSYPESFITDDSDAENAALQLVSKLQTTTVPVPFFTSHVAVVMG